MHHPRPCSCDLPHYLHKYGTHRGDIRNYDNLELVSIARENFLQMGDLRCRANSATDAVTLLQKGPYDMDRDKPIGSRYKYQSIAIDLQRGHSVVLVIAVSTILTAGC